MNELSRSTLLGLLGLLLLAASQAAAEPSTPPANRVSFSLEFTMTPGEDTRKAMLTFLIPRTIAGRQKVVKLKYSRPPLSEFNQDGNRYARFVFPNPRSPATVRMDVELDLYRYDLATASATEGG